MLSNDAKETPLDELCASTLEHYERVSTLAHEWNNQVPQAIKAWYEKKKRSLSEPAAQGEAVSDNLEKWRRWNAAGKADLRGQHTQLLNSLVLGYEKRMRPWDRAVKKSNGRMLYRCRIIKPIRGVHIRTKGDWKK